MKRIRTYGRHFGPDSKIWSTRVGHACCTTTLQVHGNGNTYGPLPPRVVDPHHHFYDTEAGSPHRVYADFLGERHIKYLPEDFARECGALAVDKSVHVEVLADDGEAEVKWLTPIIESGQSTVRAIVASCDPATPNVKERLHSLKALNSSVRGIRWVLNYDGPVQPGERAVDSRATWPTVKADYLRDPEAVQLLESMLSTIGELGLSFDLQCNPRQLLAAADIFARHPNVPVVVDHIGTPRKLTAQAVQSDSTHLDLWKQGMAALARLPQVHVKLSMFVYSVPNWFADTEQEMLAKQLTRWLIDAFGARRCMFASNWPVDGHDVPQLPLMYAKYYAWVDDLPEADREALFATTAEAFYRI